MGVTTVSVAGEAGKQAYDTANRRTDQSYSLQPQKSRRWNVSEINRGTNKQGWQRIYDNGLQNIDLWELLIFYISVFYHDYHLFF